MAQLHLSCEPDLRRSVYCNQIISNTICLCPHFTLCKNIRSRVVSHFLVWISCVRHPKLCLICWWRQWKFVSVCLSSHALQYKAVIGRYKGASPTVWQSVSDMIMMLLTPSPVCVCVCSCVHLEFTPGSRWWGICHPSWQHAQWYPFFSRFTG